MGNSTGRALRRPLTRHHLARGIAAALGLVLVAPVLVTGPAQADLTGSLLTEPTTTDASLLDSIVVEQVLDPGEVLDTGTGLVTDSEGNVTKLIDPVTGVVTDPEGTLVGVVDPGTGTLLLPPTPSIGPGGGGAIELLDQVTRLWRTICSSDGTVAKACAQLPLADLTGQAAVLLRAVPSSDGDVPQWDPANCPTVLADICMLPLGALSGDSPLAPLVAFLPAGLGSGAPDTRITSAAPGKQATAHTFSYTADPGSGTTSFQCKLEVTLKKASSTSVPQGHDWQLCGSGASGSHSYHNLANGTYAFAVRAVDGPEDAPAVDETPATQGWTLDAPAAAPRTRISAGPGNKSWVLSRRVSYRFRSSVPNSTFACSFDGASQGRACNDGAWSKRRLGTGSHVFSVFARADGARDLSPARRTFHVPLDDAALRPVRSWMRMAKQRGHFRSTVSTTTLQGAALVTRRPQKFRRVALVADRGPGHGTVEIVWNERTIGRVSLHADRLQKGEVIAVKRFTGGLRRGILRVVVVSSGEVVRVDGLGVARR